jgi:hypothetical protein
MVSVVLENSDNWQGFGQQTAENRRVQEVTSDTVTCFFVAVYISNFHV